MKLCKMELCMNYKKCSVISGYRYFALPDFNITNFAPLLLQISEVKINESTGLAKVTIQWFPPIFPDEQVSFLSFALLESVEVGVCYFFDFLTKNIIYYFCKSFKFGLVHWLSYHSECLRLLPFPIPRKR